jgi:4-diphosphocytidyl-2-C-methyl-D-erythritol kinase
LESQRRKTSGGRRKRIRARLRCNTVIRIFPPVKKRFRFDYQLDPERVYANCAIPFICRQVAPEMVEIERMAAAKADSVAYNLSSMRVTVRSFAKINLGLYIGPRRADGFHELRTVYQTIALHDLIRVAVGSGSGIEVVCDDARVPCDSTNTCYRSAEKVMEATGARGRVRIEIEKRLPVQGGLGAASSNAVATMVALERALGGSSKRKSSKHKSSAGKHGMLSSGERLRIAAEVGSDLPLFLIGGTVLGVGRGEEVYPLADLPAMPMVVVTPEVGVSTPKAFAAWDALRKGSASVSSSAELTRISSSDRLFEVGCALSAWLSGTPEAGAPAGRKGGGRAGSLLSDLVRAGIENDFERVVFSELPELRDIKKALERAGSRYASLSGSGSTLYGLFESMAAAEKAAKRLQKQGLKAKATRTLRRKEYWNKWLVISG